jgi:hypothetical protein
MALNKPRRHPGFHARNLKSVVLLVTLIQTRIGF